MSKFDDTFYKLNERESYIQKKMKFSTTYMHKMYVFLMEQSPYNKKIGYCGRGNSACIKESLSSKLVPDFKSKNFSCWLHDTLYTWVEMQQISKELADKVFYYSMLYDAGYNPFKRLTALIYYNSVKKVGIR